VLVYVHTATPRGTRPLPTTTGRRRLNGASRRVFSAVAASPLDNDRAGTHQTEENRHDHWRDDPPMQFEFLDGGHTDRPHCGGSTGLSVTDSSQGWTVITAADALSCTMSREIAKAMAVSTVSSLSTARIARSLLSVPEYPMPNNLDPGQASWRPFDSCQGALNIRAITMRERWIGKEAAPTPVIAPARRSC
jgi:hypothetical protein